MVKMLPKINRCPNCKCTQPELKNIRRAKLNNWWYVECPRCLWTGAKGWGQASAIRKWNSLKRWNG